MRTPFTKVKEILENISIENRIRFSNRMAFENLIHDLGFREDKEWEDNDELRNKISKLADEHTSSQLLHIYKYKEKNMKK